MARATTEDVKGIKSSDISDLDPFICAANLIVNDINTNCNKSFNEDRLRQIEIWLSAHFLSTLEPALIKEKFENAENTYFRGNAFKAGLESSPYGQQANLLAEGCLVNVYKSNTEIDFL